MAASAARRGGLPEEDLDDVRLAVGELCALAMSRGSSDGQISVSFTDDGSSFTVGMGWSSAHEPEGEAELLSFAVLRGIAPRSDIIDGQWRIEWPVRRAAESN